MNSLGDVAEFVRGITFKPDDIVPFDTVGSVRCMRTKNVQAEIDLSDVWSVDSSFVKRSNQYLRTGDLLVSSANSWNLVGKCCWVPEEASGSTFGGFISTLRPNREKVEPRYLYYWFSSDQIQATVRSFGRQTTNISNLDIARCLALPVPLPSVSEQRRIVQVLDGVDALRAKRRQAVSLLGDLARSIFLDMFEKSGKNWPQVTVESVAAEAKGAIRTGPFGSQLLHDEFVDSGVPVLGIDNAVANEFQWRGRRFITKEKYQKLARYTVHPGDVLITIMGTCGRCAVVPDDIPIAVNTKHLCCITLDQSKCLPEFLHSYFLMHPTSRRYLSRTSKGAIMNGLNMTIIKDLPIALPPISLQQIFVGRIKALRAAKATHAAHLTQLDALFASHQHQAFRGELWDSVAA
jgi:type I restriction enzyme S subunit